ncbi:MAG: ComF family protein [Epsilonproteobacteria bacterium]|nr:MAG: ComF family protein [Campylobacterota bacterium]
MRCTSCGKFSLYILCKLCKIKLLRPTVTKRLIDGNFAVYSFYNYEEIKNLVDSKYYFHGDRVYKELSKISFAQFNPKFDTKISAIPIDDHTRHGFSQTAILSKYFQQPNIKAIYGSLRATKYVKYAGKDLLYRQKHKRNFEYSGESCLKVVLIDDIITTGLTILEAKSCLEAHNCEILFALTLSDAKV